MPSAVVAHVVERRNVEPALGGEPAQQVAAIGRPRGCAVISAGTSTSPSPAAMTSANSASGSGFTNVTAPPMTTSGSCRVRASRARRHPGQPQHRDDVRVVPLERDRERDHVEVADGRLRFERQQRRGPTRAAPAVPASAAGTRARTPRRQVVEEPVDRLEAEARHPDEVGVRETRARRAAGRRAACARSRLRARGRRRARSRGPRSSLKRGRHTGRRMSA